MTMKRSKKKSPFIQSFWCLHVMRGEKNPVMCSSSSSNMASVFAIPTVRIDRVQCATLPSALCSHSVKWRQQREWHVGKENQIREGKLQLFFPPTAPRIRRATGVFVYSSVPSPSISLRSLKSLTNNYCTLGPDDRHTGAYTVWPWVTCGAKSFSRTEGLT